MSDIDRLTAALADRYTIERELGQGGMATVYLAEDLKHHRKVAVKVLRPELAASLGPERFMQEIEIAARLQHPHILPVHDSGTTDPHPERGEGSQSFLYYVMPYVEGESLRERLTHHGELPVHDAVRLLSEITEALAYAHHQGVVHRDIKPENIMLSGRHALVMDFGVAKAVSEASGRNRLTTAGVALGTPTYMAPEQASADPNLDQRVDIYALGVLGYELLAGRPPFTGSTAQQILAAHVTMAPEPVTSHRPTVSPALGEVIMRALQKRPADRWQTADDMLAQLEPLLTPSGGMTPTATIPVSVLTAPVSTRRVPRWSVVAAGVVIVLAAAYALVRTLRSNAAGTGAKSVAVLPFENVGGDSTNRTLTDGIQDEILTDLTRIGALQVTSRTSADEYRNTTKSVTQIGSELGVRTLLEGQVQRAGNQVHVNVQLVDAAHDRQIWAESYDRDLTADNVFAMQGDIASNVAQALQASFSTAQVAAAEKAPTTNLEALDWYHRGTELFDARGGAFNDTASVDAFERAVALDSGFAEAWAGLASARSWLVRDGVTTDTAPAHAALDRAVALDPSSPETQIAQAYFEYYARGDFDAALGHFRAVAALRPNDVAAAAGIGYIVRRRGHWNEAIDAERRVMQFDPRSVGAVVDLGSTFLALREYDKSEDLMRQALILDPAADVGVTWLFVSMVQGRGDTAAGRALVASLPAGTTVATREFATATLARYARDFDAANTASGQTPGLRLLDRPTGLIARALNDLAAGATARARLRADSAASSIHAYLTGATNTSAFGNQADFYTLLGMAEAIAGQGTQALQDGMRAIQLNPESHDVIESPRSVEGLIVIQLLLGHRDDAIQLILKETHKPMGSASVIPLTRATIRLDPIFDGIRSDPRIQAVVKNDSAWVVQ